MLETVKKWVPITHAAFLDYRVGAVHVSAKGKKVIQGPGENAGVIDIEDDDAIVFKIESHNHPSFIEPYQGAATGVGGIMRDVFTMGARPIANLNSIHFGSPQNKKTKNLLRGVVHGIGVGMIAVIQIARTFVGDGGQQILAYDDNCYSGRASILLGTGVNHPIIIHVDCATEEIGRSVTNRRHRIKTQIVLELNTLNCFIGGVVDVSSVVGDE
jgi:hypothetical protein